MEAHGFIFELKFSCVAQVRFLKLIYVSLTSVEAWYKKSCVASSLSSLS